MKKLLAIIIGLSNFHVVASTEEYDLTPFLAFEEHSSETHRNIPKNEFNSILTLTAPGDNSGGDLGGGGTGESYPIGTNFKEQFTLDYQVTPLTSKLFGERYSTATGAVTFNQTDISIPGNSSLPVNFSRNFVGLEGIDSSSRELGVWSIDLPHVRTNLLSDASYSTPQFKGIWAAGLACSGDIRDHGDYSPAVDNTRLEPEKGQSFWNGDNIYIPEYGTEKIIQKFVSGSIYKTTANNWRIQCQNVSGTDAFVVTTPDGKKYTFSQLRVLKGKSLKLKISTAALPSPVHYKSYRIYHAFMLPSRIEDRFGNYVTFVYGTGSRLESIMSNDGRKITITYNSMGFVDFVYEHSTSTTPESGKKWSYQYSLLGTHFDYGSIYGLSRVIRPDGKVWEYSDYNFSSLFGTHSRSFDSFEPCNMIGMQSGNIIKIKHPEGAIGSFSFAETQFKRSAIPKLRIGPNPWVTPPGDLHTLERMQWDAYSKCPTQFSLTQKKITLPNGPEYIWNYKYYGKIGYFSGESPNTDLDVNTYFSSLGITDVPYSLSLYDLKSTVVTNPDGSKVAYHFSSKYGWTENKEIYEDYYDRDGVSLLYRESKHYTPSSLKGNSFVRDDSFSGYASRLDFTRRLYNYDDGTDVFEETNSGFNEYDTPTVTELNFNGNEKFIKTDYQHDTNSWVLNLPAKEYISNSNVFGSPYKETIYNAQLLPEQEKAFGNLIKSYVYYLDGNLLQTNYNGSNYYEKFENYYRGKSRKITLPCTTTNGCNTTNGSTVNTVVALVDVNNDGSISSITDFNGNKTLYSYNLIGWLTKIDYSDTKWADKIISYSDVTINEDGINGSGIVVGDLRQTISQGNYEKRIYLDSLLRPIYTRERDVTNSETSRYQAYEYDYANRQLLASFPSNSSSNRLGMENQFDALGRILTQTRNSDSSIVSHQYLAGNKVSVADGEGNITTTSYLAYGTPDYKNPTLIEAPDTDDTYISYNPYGQITQITQGNVTENRIYDSFQELCKTIRPEIGITVYAYNAQRNPIWRAEGTNGSTTSCDVGAVPANHKVLIGYDNQEKVRTESFPDGESNRTYLYDANGNLTQLTSGNTVWGYQYNSFNLLEKETLTLDGKSFVLDWNYNNLGAVSSLIYPSGASLTFSPNALGQPTQAGAYATAVSYFPNGQVKQLTYGNGIVRTIQQDSSGRTDLLTDTKSGSLRNKLDPAYDRNDNLIQLLDLVDRSYDINNIHYDGVDRLISANGKWGTGSFSYDGLGNLLSRSYNSSTIGFQYNSRNLLNNLTGAYAYKYQYDARGNVINNGRYALSYNRAQQMTSAKSISYVYDGFNRKVKKTNSSGNSYTVYGKDGLLLYRLAPNGTQTDSIYLGKQIVAEVDR